MFGKVKKYFELLFLLLLISFKSIAHCKEGNKDTCIKYEVEKIINDEFKIVSIYNNCILETGIKVRHGQYQRIGLISGNVFEKGNYDYGKKNGKWIYYYFNADTLRIENYLNDVLNGYWYEFHENGILWNKGIFENGIKIGIWEHYNINGIKISSGKYTGAKIINFSENALDSLFRLNQYNKGIQFPIVLEIKDKIWMYWNNEGKLIKEENWDNSKLISVKVY